MPARAASLSVLSSRGQQVLGAAAALEPVGLQLGEGLEEQEGLLPGQSPRSRRGTQRKQTSLELSGPESCGKGEDAALGAALGQTCSSASLSPARGVWAGQGGGSLTWDPASLPAHGVQRQLGGPKPAHSTGAGRAQRGWELLYPLRAGGTTVPLPAPARQTLRLNRVCWGSGRAKQLFASTFPCVWVAIGAEQKAMLGCPVLSSFRGGVSCEKIVIGLNHRLLQTFFP